MDLSLFEFSLPREYIAQYPLSDRDQSKLFCIRRNSSVFEHRQFSEIPCLLQRGDVLVLNDTRVFPARLMARTQQNESVEVFLVKETGNRVYKTLLRPKKKLFVGQVLYFNDQIEASIVDLRENIICFQQEVNFDVLAKIGNVPLPPYIRRSAESADRERYQTVYAAHTGAIAAPTAGLHFAKRTLEALAESGVEIVFLTLHIGYATFQKIPEGDISSYRMGEEEVNITQQSAERINLARSQKRRIIAVGTSVVRSLESAFQGDKLCPFQGPTRLFISPGFTFRVVDGFLTNFHLPKSSPFILTCAFTGRELLLKAYHEAMQMKYRFYSYGDAMFIV